MHQFGWLSERGGNFSNLPQKEGLPRTGVSLTKGGGGGVPNREETMSPEKRNKMQLALNMLNH